MIFGAEMLRLLLHVLHQVGAVDALRESREILHQGGERELSAGFVAADDQRLQIGARGVDGGRIAGAAGTDNDYVSHGQIQISTRAASVKEIAQPLPQAAGRPLRRVRPGGGREIGVGFRQHQQALDYLRTFGARNRRRVAILRR